MSNDRFLNVIIKVSAIMLVILIAVVAVIIVEVNEYKNRDVDNSLPSIPNSTDISEQAYSDAVNIENIGLDPEFSNLLIVNADNLLERNNEYENNLVSMEDKYCIGSLRKINSDVWPYLKAMIEDAWADGVDLKVLSPYRSYDVQNRLFKEQLIRAGGDEEKAASVVAKPGTSEHNTGLCVDFNEVEESFENTDMFVWLNKNAENYGFILRYPKDKEEITRIMYEPWHWRFVGINEAKKINKEGVTLEEYVYYNYR